MSRFCSERAVEFVFGRNFTGIGAKWEGDVRLNTFDINLYGLISQYIYIICSLKMNNLKGTHWCV